MFNAAMLYLESQCRRTMPNDAQIHLGHRAVMDPRALPAGACLAGAGPAPQPHLDCGCPLA
jgi:hypothetical protein